MPKDAAGYDTGLKSAYVGLYAAGPGLVLLGGGGVFALENIPAIFDDDVVG